MALTPGTRLGPYEIVSVLGAGGMGTVYRARDGRLNRDVAIKVLPDEFAHDPDRLARFKREAQVLGSLSHQHIGAIFGFEEFDGAGALVLELVEGPTLADRIAQAPLLIEEALPLARQIAEALETAHEHGIIHRDLKPANIKLRPDGVVKVLDFGLAKANDQHSSSSVSISPTITSPALGTHMGVILGTAAYMSPEQARGQPVDKRTDIWAFGCVLYEMLTGRGAFPGEDVTDTIAAIVRAEPDWTALPPGTPAAIRTTLRRCLEKDRKERAPDIGMARLDIKEALRWPDGDPTPTHDVPKRKREHFRWAVACLMGAAIAASGVWFLIAGSEDATPISRVLVSAAPADRLATGGAGTSSLRPSRTAIAVSPDGRTLVFSATRAGTQQLYLRAMDRLEATPIAGTEGSSNPFISPDGKWIGFWQGAFVSGATGELKKVPLGGGPPVPLCKTPILSGASWGWNDTIVFSPSAAGGGVWRVAAAGGVPQQLTTVDPEKGEFSHRLPQMLPGTESVIFTIQKANRRWDDAQVVVRSLATGEQKVLIDGGADARYVPTGHLVYARTGALMAVPFDLPRMMITGNHIGILDGVMQDVNSILATGDSGAAQFSVSRSGALVYLPGGIYPDAERTLVWVDRKGTVEPMPAQPRSYTSPRLSPDGQRLSFSTNGTVQNVWIQELSRGTASRVTTEDQNMFGVWTPDGKRMTFSSAKTGPLNLVWKSVDAGSRVEQLGTHKRQQIPISWSRDGKALAYLQHEAASSNNDIWILSFNGDAVQGRAFLETPFQEQYPEFSPDGRWLAYTSDESGRSEVYVQPYQGPGGRIPVSAEGGVQPAWAPNGRELFYTTIPVSGAMKMMAVDVTTVGTAFSAGPPRVLFEGRYAVSTPTRNYDVTPDGQRFVMITPDERGLSAPPLTEMVFVLNWFEELKRLVPTK